MGFTTVGFDELEKMLLRQSEEAEVIAPEMLEAGAKVLIAAQRAELSRTIKTESTGTLANSIGMGKITKTRDATGMYVNVYPQGNQPHGNPLKLKVSGKKQKGVRRGKPVTNAQVGFTLEHGSKSRNIAARRWMEAANFKSETAIHEAMKAVWDGKMNE